MAELIELRGQGCILLGLLVLLVTPVLRVAVSIVAFAIQKDYTFMVITVIVLAVLILSFSWGRREVRGIARVADGREMRR